MSLTHNAAKSVSISPMSVAFPAGYFWYRGKRKGPGRPPKWVDDFLSSGHPANSNQPTVDPVQQCDENVLTMNHSPSQLIHRPKQSAARDFVDPNECAQPCNGLDVCEEPEGEQLKTTGCSALRKWIALLFRHSIPTAVILRKQAAYRMTLKRRYHLVALVSMRKVLLPMDVTRLSHSPVCMHYAIRNKLIN